MPTGKRQLLLDTSAETRRYYNQQKYNYLFSEFPLFITQALKDASLVPWTQAHSKNDVW